MTTLTKRFVLLAASVLVFGAASTTASARFVIHPRVVVVPHAGFPRAWGYSPYLGPWYPYAYPYTVTADDDASIKTSVSPRDTKVFIDGYYAGQAGDFDGAFHRLHVVPGGHTVSFFRDGFRTVSEEIYVRPDSTFKLGQTMNPLARGETSAPVPPPPHNPVD